MMTYASALRYLNGFVNYERVARYDYSSSFELGRMRSLARALGDPQNDIPSVHIAGSKGKGSTAAFLHSILTAAGYRAGLYTSPHLITFRERIRVNAAMISERDLARIVDRLRSAVDQLPRALRPTFFELTTALAYLYFREKRPDIVIYEVGLGGRLDATNILTPLACAITPLSYEHTDKLGATLTEIAREKCGIIKAGVPCVSAPQEKEALAVIRHVCARARTRLILVGRDLFFRVGSANESGSRFDLDIVGRSLSRLGTRLPGEHQVVNASVAAALADVVGSAGFRITDMAIRQGLRRARWPCRLEVISRRPYIVLDGAHNRASARALASSITELFRHDRLILILGVSSDKDVAGIIDELLPITDHIILTKSRLRERALEPSKMKPLIKETDFTVTSSVRSAFARARSIARKNDMILVAGSLFVAGEVKEYAAHAKT